jgi:hypothetical protein
VRWKFREKRSRIARHVKLLTMRNIFHTASMRWVTETGASVRPVAALVKRAYFAQQAKNLSEEFLIPFKRESYSQCTMIMVRSAAYLIRAILE